MITILYQPIAGLQVDDSHGNWVDVSPSSTDFVINTGETMKRLTNNVYQAANHRVKFINSNRVSVPFFVEPGFNSILESFTPGKAENEIQCAPIKYGEWLINNLRKYKEYQRSESTG